MVITPLLVLLPLAPYPLLLQAEHGLAAGAMNDAAVCKSSTQTSRYMEAVTSFVGTAGECCCCCRQSCVCDMVEVSQFEILN
jgi:hypothetical protein